MTSKVGIERLQLWLGYIDTKIDGFAPTSHRDMIGNIIVMLC